MECDPAARRCRRVTPRLIVLSLLLTGCQSPEVLASFHVDDYGRERNPRTSEASAVDIAWLPPTVSRHAAHFVAAGREHGVDPEMLAIVSLVESGGWIKARSPSGARGLMQVMPATASVIARDRALSDHDHDKLYDPPYNIDFGAWYLASQLARFGTDDGDASVELAAAAYNGGPGRLSRHLEGEAELSDQTLRYKHWVRAMWTERRREASETFETWRRAGGERLLDKARNEL